MPCGGALFMRPMGAPRPPVPRRARVALADDVSPAAYGRRVGGTMVLAGVCGVVPPGPGRDRPRV